MVILRDEQRIARLAKLAQILSLVGIGVLILGLVMIFIARDDPNVFLYQLAALFTGFAISQVGLYFSHRYLRKPRPDQVLDKAVGKYARKKDGRLYHYLLPASHVLLLNSAVVLLVAKYQTGNISVQDDKWRQTGIGLRGFIGQEKLGNPTRDAEKQLQKMEQFIEQNAPAASGANMFPVIVFTAPNIDNLDLSGSSIPAKYHSKLAGYLRQRDDLRKPMDSEQYEALRAAFDQKAGHLIEETVNADDG